MTDDFWKKNRPTSSSGGGYRPLHDMESEKPAKREETLRARAERQRRERQEELRFSVSDEERWARNRAKVSTDEVNRRVDNWLFPRPVVKKVGFELGWMQSPVTQSQQELWNGLFTSETTEEQKQYIQQCNEHLNEPVRQGEIVLFPTAKPETAEEQRLFDEWMEEAKIASAELGKLLDEEIVTLNRHFELFTHQLDEKIRKDGLPTDYYAQVSTGVGATAAFVEQNLKNIQNVLLDINHLYASQVAMASRTGGVNYGAFVADRAELFKKLDGSFAILSKRSVQLPVYTQIKRNLKLSTKSVIHNADEILKTGFVKDLGKRIGNIAIGISAARGLGFVGLGLGVSSGVSAIYEACKVDGKGDFGKATTREVAGFIGGVAGGIQGGNAGVGLAVAAVSGIALVIGVTASAPVLAVAAIGGAVAGGFVGGVAGGAAGKALGDGVYFLYESSTDIIADIEVGF